MNGCNAVTNQVDVEDKPKVRKAKSFNAGDVIRSVHTGTVYLVTTAEEQERRYVALDNGQYAQGGPPGEWQATLVTAPVTIEPGRPA